MSELEKALDNLFAAYRRLCPDPEVSAGFMPRLWEKIDARRSFAFKLRLYARGLVSVAAALCLAVAVFQFSSLANGGDPVAETYLDVLRSDNPPETLAYSGVISSDDNVSGLDVQ